MSVNELEGPVVLHLGAHRTGTTRLQTILDQNTPVLANAALVALTPPYEGKRQARTVRDAIRAAHGAIDASPLKRLWLMWRSRVDMAQWMRHERPTRRLVLSDENILGLPFDRQTGEAIYPRIEACLASVLRSVRRPVSAAYLSVRPYSSFLVSVYAMTAVYGGSLAPFDALRRRLLSPERRWQDVVEAVRAQCPGVPLTVWCFGRVDIHEQLASLLGADVAQRLQFDTERRVNSAPTLEAMAYVQAHPGLSPTERDAAIEHFKDGETFDPLSALERARLDSAYRHDLETIRQMDGVTVVP